jgi:hypothetical protein
VNGQSLANITLSVEGTVCILRCSDVDIPERRESCKLPESRKARHRDKAENAEV